MIRIVDATGDHFETCHRRKDDSLYDVEISTNGAEWGEQKLVFCVCRDISRRKAVEKELKKRVKELEDFYNIAIGRELRMKDLKDQIEDMKKEMEKLKKKLEEYEKIKKQDRFSPS